MRYLLVILVLFSSTNLFADQYLDCLDRINVTHYTAIVEAQETLKRETEDCYRYPVGDQYYICQNKAQDKHQKAVARAKAILKQQNKSCMKFPWI